MAAKDEKGFSKAFLVPQGSRVVPDNYDVRVLTKNLSLGRISVDQLKDHLSSLPDESDNCERMDYAALVEDDHSNGQADQQDPSPEPADGSSSFPY